MRSVTKKPVVPPRSAVPRRKGRPVGQDNIGADRVLTAARQLLRDKRPDQLTQTNIAKAAGVDPKLVRYYFGTLDNLLVQLAHRFILDISDRLTAISDIPGTTAEKIELRIKTLLSFYVETPNFWPLLLDKIYLASDAKAKTVRRDFNKTSYQRLENIVLKGIELDEVRGDIDARFLYMVLLGVCEIFATAKPIRDVLFSEYEQDGLAERYADFLSKIIVNGLKPLG
ncbi:TetR/AcrR family transcriptional regulator [Bradyrhizobium sp. AUGA SZCCT0182]|nr:TetR/AcrR family transcriptional regulator [Bradyrhizobium sp. AUGA SZCCT0182]